MPVAMHKEYLAHRGIAQDAATASAGNIQLAYEKNTDSLGNELFSGSDEARSLGEISSEGKNSVEWMQLRPNGSATITFTLREPSMVNLWVDTAETGVVYGMGPVPLIRDFTLQLSGGPLSTPYTSRKAGTAAESVSSVLPAGTYTLTIQDDTTYPQSETIGATDTPRMPVVPVSVEISRYSSSHIRGRMSTPERAMSMPVTMSVAEFKETQTGKFERVETINAKSLDPNKPVWVIAHGMNSRENSVTIKNLTKTMFDYAQQNNFQVVTVDWNEAARDPLLIGRDAPWTVAVGKWVARQLLAAGFTPSMINGEGHSHGNYCLYSMGQELIRLTNGDQMNAFVALDPAENLPAITEFDHRLINFATVSRYSIAIESSFGAGSDRLAGTADVAFHMNSPTTLLPSTEHQLALTGFTKILEHERGAPGHFSSFFSIQQIMSSSGEDHVPYVKDQYRGVFEGIIDVGVKEEQSENETYFQAHPMNIRFIDLDGQEKTAIFDSLA